MKPPAQACPELLLVPKACQIQISAACGLVSLVRAACVAPKAKREREEGVKCETLMSGQDRSEHGGVGGASEIRSTIRHQGGDLYDQVSRAARGMNGDEAGIYRGVGGYPRRLPSRFRRDNLSDILCPSGSIRLGSQFLNDREKWPRFSNLIPPPISPCQPSTVGASVHTTPVRTCGRRAGAVVDNTD